MVAPNGFCGVHNVPKAGHWLGFFKALQDLPGDADLRFFGLDVLHLEFDFRIVIDGNRNASASSRSWGSIRCRATAGRRVRRRRR